MAGWHGFPPCPASLLYLFRQQFEAADGISAADVVLCFEGRRTSIESIEAKDMSPQLFKGPRMECRASQNFQLLDECCGIHNRQLASGEKMTIVFEVPGRRFP